MTTFTHNGTTMTCELSNKAKEMGIEAFSIKGVRWFQKTYGNTYHIAYVSALVNGRWQELGATKTEYGYGDHYLVTAGDWLIENGFINCTTGYALVNYSVREALNIEHYSEDVKRKKDM